MAKRDRKRWVTKTLWVCITPSCENMAHTRGLCETCYITARNFSTKPECQGTTRSGLYLSGWEWLEYCELALPPKKLRQSIFHNAYKQRLREVGIDITKINTYSKEPPEETATSHEELFGKNNE